MNHRESLCSVLDKTPELSQLLSNPGIPVHQKKNIIDKIFTGSLEGTCLKYLLDHDLICHLDDILEAVYDLHLQQNKVLEGTLAYAKNPPAESQLKAMEDSILDQQKMNSIDWTFVHQPDLLDGFTLDIGGKFYDYSLNGKFDQLLDHLNRR